MLSAEKNRELTETGPGTPAGRLMRAYWLPVALSRELDNDPLGVRVLGEDLVLYRAPSGEVRLIAERCPHRGTSLRGGRIEPRGIRCCYHGWLFDASGQCIEQPGEPAESGFADKVRIAAYPARDAYDFIWAYLGDGPPPELPPYDVLARDDGDRRVARSDVASNYLQVLENSVDPVHTAILHVGTDLQQAYEEIPEFDYEETAAGIRTVAWRPGSGYLRHVEFSLPTLTRVALPFMKPVVQMGFWITPVDDTRCTLFLSWFLPAEPGADPAARRQEVERMERHMFETDPDDRNTLTSRVILQDVFACESQGPSVDRSAEWLGHSDRAIIALRRQLEDAIAAVAAGDDPPAVLRERPAGVIHFDRVN